MNTRKILCVIPARLSSTRLPKKPLLLIGDKPMIQWTFEGASRCNFFSKVIVATDAPEIAEIITKLGGHVELTPSDLPTGTDRVAYVAEKFPEYEVIANVQGDEPFIKPEMCTSLVEPYLNGLNPPMATLGYPPESEEEFNNPNIPKVIFNKLNNAIYFSRSPIPYYRQRNVENVPILMHLGLYAYTREFLLRFTKLEQTPLEKTELLEQLRALENGIPIYVSRTSHKIIEVNNQEELELARKFCQTLDSY